MFSYSHAAVVADSFICVMPQGTQGMLFATYRVCDSMLLTPANRVWCIAGNLTVQHVYDTTMAMFPKVTFVSVNSKEDLGQVRYYNMLSNVFRGQPRKITGDMFYRMASMDFAIFNRHPN